MWHRAVATLMVMCCLCGSASATAHLYCWEPSLALVPVDQSFRERIRALRGTPPSPKMVTFVVDLLARYAEATETEDTPWADGPLVGNIRGGFSNISLIWPRYREATPFVITTAHKHGLHCFDFQTGRFHPAAGT